MDMETAAVKTAEETLADYKRAANKVTLFLMIFFLMRYAAQLIVALAVPPIKNSAGDSAAFIVNLLLSSLLVEIAPAVIGFFLFGINKKGGLKPLYSVPKRMNKAIANFPAIYGASQFMNILTLLVIFLVSQNNDLAKSINTVNSLQPPGIAAAIVLFISLAVIAPLFEEFMFRGLIMNALKPYGNGFSIIASGLIFGLCHGNFNQLFYTAVAGIAWGYIANVTNSLLPTTVMHFIFNGISGALLLLLSTDSVQRFILNKENVSDAEMILPAVYAILMVCLLALILIGTIAAIVKLKNIKRYKVKKVCPELTNGKKTAVLFCSVTALISILLIIDTFAGFSDVLFEGLMK